MAARISGVTLPNDKKIEVALTYIYGIGLTTSRKFLAQIKIDPNIRTKDLSPEQVNDLRNVISKGELRIEGELKREVLSNIKRLKEIGSFRGSRHTKGLPVRGQRTKTNTRTVRGNTRKTVGSGRKLAAQKT